MNKSKFLKKSLAAVLAVLMVVAMIPLSAAAADPAVVSRVSVNTVDATEEGTVWTAKIDSDSSVTVNVTLANDNATAVVTHEAGTNGSAASAAPNAQGVWTFTMSDEERAAKEAKFLVWDERGAAEGKEYTVKFELNEGSNDVSVKSITVDTQYGETAVDGDTYTITLPYGTVTRPALHIVLNNDNAQVTAPTASKTNGVWVTSDSVSITDGKSETKVTVENGETTHIYTVKTVNASAFAAFSVAGERKAAKIEPDHSGGPQITVYMPYGSNAKDGKFKITPTYTPGYASVDIKATRETAPAGDVAFESGKEIELDDYDNDQVDGTDPIDGATIVLKVSYSDVGTAETWNVVFDVPDNDPAPVLKELTLGTFKATIDETNHTAVLNVPKSVRDGTTPASATNTLFGLASPGAKIHVTDVANVVAQTIASTPASIALNLKGDKIGDPVDLGIATKNNFIIRVTSAGDEEGRKTGDAGFTKCAVQDYKLTINTVDTVGKAEITEMILEDDSDAKNQYKAEIKDNVITFTVPFATTSAKASLDDWKLYYGLSNGTYINSGLTKVSGEEIATSGDAWVPSALDGTKKVNAIVVSNGESTTSYTVAVKLAAARTAKSLSGVKIGHSGVLADNTNFGFDNMKDGENTFAATGSIDMTVSIPYSKYVQFIGGFAPRISATLSEGAGLFYVDDSKVLHKVKVLTKAGETATATESLPTVDKTNYPWDGKEVSGKINKLTLYVVNEKGLKNANGSDKITSGTTTESQLEVGTFIKYTLIGKQADPQNLHVLDSFSIYDSVTKTKIPAQVDSRNHKINLTLPASFVFDGTNGLTGAVKRTMYFDYSTSHYEIVDARTSIGGPVIGSAANFKKLTLNTDGSVKTADSTAVSVATRNPDGSGVLKMDLGGTDYAVASLRVMSEAYTVNDKGGYQDYEVVVKYADVELGSTLNSVTINGVTAQPDANGKVSITLPKSSELTGLKPTFNVSEYANVSSQNTLGSNNANLIKSGDIMNFTQPKTVWVLSEDGANKQKYTIEVKINDGFSDVKSSDWFYSYVTEAAKRGIILGYTDGRFGPNDRVTRVQFATMMARVDGFKASEWEGKASKFSDMNGITGEPAAAVAYCADKGYITGDGGATTFRPNATITRQEMAIIISRVMNLNTTDVNIGTRFADDAKIADWAKNYVYACVNANMLQGEGNNTFNPLGSTTRAAAATAAIRVDNAK